MSAARVWPRNIHEHDRDQHHADDQVLETVCVVSFTSLARS